MLTWVVLLKRKNYSVIKLPIELDDRINKFKGKYGFKSKTEFVKEAVRSRILLYEQLELSCIDFPPHIEEQEIVPLGK